MPPPPGLDRIAARSLQKLKDHVQWLELQQPAHETDDHAVWLRLCLLAGTIVVALIMIWQWNSFTPLLRRQLAKLRYFNRADDSEPNTQRSEWEFCRHHAAPTMSRKQAFSTGIDVVDRWVFKSREIPPKGPLIIEGADRDAHVLQVLSEKIAHQMDSVVHESPGARKRAVHSAGKE